MTNENTERAAHVAEMQETLSAARSAVEQAEPALRQWDARISTPERPYNGAGHDAVIHIDAALDALHRLRSTLVGELRRDADERAVRIDAMLAWRHAEGGEDQ